MAHLGSHLGSHFGVHYGSPGSFVPVLDLTPPIGGRPSLTRREMLGPVTVAIDVELIYEIEISCEVLR